MNIADAREKLLADMERELRSPTNPENRELLYRRRTALARSHQSEVPQKVCDTPAEFWEAMREWRKSMPVAASGVMVDDNSEPLV